jgi:Mrp family chromosome partitioning ATPase
LRLEQAFDTVIIDAPPLLPVTDAAVLSQHVGGVVVVVGSQKLRQHDLEKSMASLKLVGASVLGIVLNRLPSKGPDAYAYSYYSNDDKSQVSERSARPRPGSRARVRSDATAPAEAHEEHLGSDDTRPATVFPLKR